MKKQTRYGAIIAMKNKCEAMGAGAHKAGDEEMKKFWQAAAEGFMRRAMRLTPQQCFQYV